MQLSEKSLGVGLPRVLLRVLLKNPDTRNETTTLPVSVGSALPSNTQLCLFAVN